MQRGLVLLTVTHLSIESQWYFACLLITTWILYLLLGLAFQFRYYSLVSVLPRSEHKTVTSLFFTSYGKSCHNGSQLTELESSQVKNFHAIKPQWNAVILCLLVTFNLLFSQIENFNLRRAIPKNRNWVSFVEVVNHSIIHFISRPACLYYNLHSFIATSF